MGIKTSQPGVGKSAIISEKPPHHMGIKTHRWLSKWSECHASEKPPHHMGIKTPDVWISHNQAVALKNLPTTWGLRRCTPSTCGALQFSEKPPHHMGIKTALCSILAYLFNSEKPPHHMGIKTFQNKSNATLSGTLKNLPTTWGLRLLCEKLQRLLHALWKTSPPHGD